jgi:hypothetical protein
MVAGRIEGLLVEQLRDLHDAEAQDASAAAGPLSQKLGNT